jgi:hypothetical protein
MAMWGTTADATAYVVDQGLTRYFTEEFELAHGTPARKQEILDLRTRRAQEAYDRREAERIRREKPVAEMWLSIYAPDQVYDPAIHFIPDEPECTCGCYD